jgi:two-component system response regulator HupR/HoxA
VLSGYTQVTTLLTAINRGEIFRFITKPWKIEQESKAVLQQAVDYYNLQAERDRLAEELATLKQSLTAGAAQ